MPARCRRGCQPRALFSMALSMAGSRVRDTATAAGAAGPAAPCRSLLPPEVQPLCLPRMQGSRVGRRWEAPTAPVPRHGSGEQGHMAGKPRALKRREEASGDVGETTQDVVFPPC